MNECPPKGGFSAEAFAVEEVWLSPALETVVRSGGQPSQYVWSE